MATANSFDAVGSHPSVQTVSIGRPIIWVRNGISDMLHHPGASLAYGLLVTIIGAMILMFGSHPYFLAAAVSGFLLVGPIMSTGLCELSRGRALGEPVLTGPCTHYRISTMAS